MNALIKTIHKDRVALSNNIMLLQFPLGVCENDALDILEKFSSLLLMSESTIRLIIIPGDIPITPASILAFKEQIQKLKKKICMVALVSSDNFRKTVFKSLAPSDSRRIFFFDSLQEAYRFLKPWEGEQPAT